MTALGNQTVAPKRTEQQAASQAQPQIGTSGVAARDLIDQQALPSWMTQQSGTPPFPAAKNEASGQSGLAASSLLDADALPSWMRESGQEQRSTSQPRSSTSVPQGQPGQGMPASSLMDMNAMPEWLRAVGEQHPGGMGSQSGQLGNYPQPMRAENMRVPSRPRGEANPNESSEVAANVFASMLGVTAPPANFSNAAPAVQQPPQNYPNAGPTSQQLPPMNPYYQQQGQMGPAGSANQGGQGGPASQPLTGGNWIGTNTVPQTPGGNAGSYAPPGYSGNMPGTGSGLYPNNGQMNAPVGNPNIGQPSSIQPARSSGATEQKGAKKRGLFGSFLDWFSR
jgi:hypothetical protein